MPEIELNDDQGDFLRRFIARLKNWSEDNPPSQSELEALRQEFRLTRGERETLAKLALNHIRRGRRALADGDYDQAAAELARASQLKPRDPAPRIELADVHLKRFQRRGLHRSDKRKAMRLAMVAQELQPRHSEVQRFLRENNWTSSQLRQRKIRYSILLLLLFISLIAGILLWGREWIFSFFRGPPPVITRTRQIDDAPIPESRSIQVETSQLDDGLLKTEIVFAEVGRRNDSSYLHIIGRLESPEHNLESLSLLIQGRDMSSGILFSMPWTVLDKGDPPLRTGETLPLTSFRWLAEGEENIQRIELITLEKNHLANPGTPVLSEVEVVWEAPRPEGSALTAGARNRRFVEAYDRQVVLMDIILENTGVSALSELSFRVTLNPAWPQRTYSAVDAQAAPLAGGERRVIPITMSLPLSVQAANIPITMRIGKAQGS